MSATSARRLRLALLAVVLVAAVTLSLVLGGSTVDRVERVVDDAGVLGPVVFVVLYAALTVLLVPGVIMTVAGGALFGPVGGTLLSLLGATAGAAAAFFLARRLRLAPPEAGGRLARIDAWIAERGFWAVLYARLVPIVPFNVLNYAAGLTRVSAAAYIAATAIGIVPGTFAYAALGGSVGDPASLQFLGAVALVAVLTGVGVLASRRARSTSEG